MTQSELNRGVARSTDESVSEISRRGFVPIEDLDRQFNPPIDWDEREARRNVIIYQKRKAKQGMNHESL